jgi:hypothetical protein
MDPSINRWSESVDEIETDFFAMALAIVITEAIRFLIVGEFPRLKGVDPTKSHTHIQKLLLLLWALTVAVFGSSVILFLNAHRERRPFHYAGNRLVSFITSLVPMCIAWALVDWGQWHFYEAMHAQPVYGRVLFAIACTFFGLAGIWIISRPNIARSKPCLHEMAIKCFALMAGWSWEQAFDATFEEGLKIWWFKFGVAVLVGAVIVPIMALYLKPITEEIKESMRHPKEFQYHHDHHHQQAPVTVYLSNEREPVRAEPPSLPVTETRLADAPLDWPQSYTTPLSTTRVITATSPLPQELRYSSHRLR